MKKFTYPKPWITLSNVVIQEVDSKKRMLRVVLKASVSEKTSPLLFHVDQGALISNEKRELMKLGEFKPGQIVSVSYVEKSETDPVLKILVLERFAGEDSKKAVQPKGTQHGISENRSGADYAI